jgi:hypothetical protein
MALPFGKESRNGVIYNRDRSVEISGSLVGKPFLFNHNENHVLGHVTAAPVKEDGIYYEVDIDPSEDRFINKCRRKDITTVSIQGIIDKVINENEILLSEFIELSAAPLPGFKDTTITTMEKFIADAKKESGGEGQTPISISAAKRNSMSDEQEGKTPTKEEPEKEPTKDPVEDKGAAETAKVLGQVAETLKNIGTRLEAIETFISEMKKGGEEKGKLEESLAKGGAPGAVTETVNDAEVLREAIMKP